MFFFKKDRTEHCSNHCGHTLLKEMLGHRASYLGSHVPRVKTQGCCDYKMKENLVAETQLMASATWMELNGHAQECSWLFVCS